MEAAASFHLVYKLQNGAWRSRAALTASDRTGRGRCGAGLTLPLMSLPASSPASRLWLKREMKNSSTLAPDGRVPVSEPLLWKHIHINLHYCLSCGYRTLITSFWPITIQMCSIRNSAMLLMLTTVIWCPCLRNKTISTVYNGKLKSI